MGLDRPKEPSTQSYLLGLLSFPTRSLVLLPHLRVPAHSQWAWKRANPVGYLEVPPSMECGGEGEGGAGLRVGCWTLGS